MKIFLDNDTDKREKRLYDCKKIKVYIKLTINDRGVICLSFHKSKK